MNGDDVASEEGDRSCLAKGGHLTGLTSEAIRLEGSGEVSGRRAMAIRCGEKRSICG